VTNRRSRKEERVQCRNVSLEGKQENENKKYDMKGDEGQKESLRTSPSAFVVSRIYNESTGLRPALSTLDDDVSKRLREALLKQNYLHDECHVDN